MNGYWADDNTIDNEKSRESFILIIGDVRKKDILKGHAKKWMKEYNQDAFLYREPSMENLVELIYQDGAIDSIKDFHPDRIARAYSKLSGRDNATFVIESASNEKNWISKLSIS